MPEDEFEFLAMVNFKMSQKLWTTNVLEIERTQNAFHGRSVGEHAKESHAGSESWWFEHLGPTSSPSTVYCIPICLHLFVGLPIW
jgi:hypothetical protein